MRNPWALWALATAILPWFFIRPRTPENPRKIAFPALFLLTSATEKDQKTRRRRRILLAATRSAALVALTFVWAEPFFDDAQKETLLNLQTVESQWVSEISGDRAPKRRRVENGTIDGRPIRVLIVDGADSGEPRFGENSRNPATAQNPPRPSAAFYWAAALNPTFDVDDETTTQVKRSQRFPRVEITSSTDFSLLSPSELAAFDVLLFVDVSAPTTSELDKIQRFIKDGVRAFVVCAGPRIRLERWNEIWRRFDVSARTFDVDLSPPTSDEPRRPFAPDGEASLQAVENNDVAEIAFRAPFEKTANSGIDALPIWRAFPTLGADVVPMLRDEKTQIPIVAKIALKNAANDENVANGAAIFWVATVPDERVGALAFAPNFVPLATRIVESALGETSANGASRKTPIAESSAAARFNARRNEKTNVVLWSIFAIFVALEFLLTFSKASERLFGRRAETKRATRRENASLLSRR